MSARAIHRAQPLLYYDGVQLFEAADVIGGHYICLLAEPGSEIDKYLAVGVSPERLQNFKLGQLDLLELIRGREIVDWFTLETQGDLTDDLVLREKGDQEIPTEWLPEPWFFLSGTESSNEDVLSQAKSQSNLVLELRTEPPEAATDARIRATKLAGLLFLFQTVVTRAYKKALSDLSPTSLRSVDSSEGHLLDVYAHAPGSYRVWLQSARGPDLLGDIELERSLLKFDELTQDLESPNKAIETLRKNKGHLASAYIKLLKFLVSNDANLTYKWALPRDTKPRGRALPRRYLEPLLEAFSKTEKLTVETVVLSGFLRQADSERSTWRLETFDDKKEFSGRLRGDRIRLGGLVIDGLYRFACEEELEEIAGTGAEKRTLYLVDAESLQRPPSGDS
jgi:hypothetical protein